MYSNDIKYHDEFLKEHHEVVVPGTAHAFWWLGDDDVCRLNLHLYLDAHDHNRRRAQLDMITDKVNSFRRRMMDVPVVIVASGDRNFVVKPEQHSSSADSSWHPGSLLFSAWLNFLSSIGAVLDHELDEPTFIKFIRRSDGGSGWTLRTLDFGSAGYDPVRFADWQCSVSICDGADRRSSDHKPVEIRFRQRHRPRPKTKIPAILLSRAGYSKTRLLWKTG